ncbi:MAG: 50S ribosomal protein L32 [Microgenomates group bacterium]|nr:50S ribosomal protein L32 [Candidatus Woesebacteria bacterium]MBP6883249.1 50S ribosomal protein L32 [Candidatus Woesebacteria bacterium]QQR64266.1 MAG: 50S ribosomal protein L32 [Candidatus Roizmanbacteria bacterium]
MAPLPKRKHSQARKGRRMSERVVKLSNLVACAQCGKPKLPHLMCKYCGK